MLALSPAAIGLALGAALFWNSELNFVATAPAASMVPAPPSAEPAADPPGAIAGPSPAPTAASRATPPPPTATTSPTASPTPVRPGVPVRLRIPAIGVDAPVVPVGSKPDGELEAPNEGHQVGWYRLGARPGEAGNAILDGHVDWQRSLAVFWHLGRLNPGDEILVSTEDGLVLPFRVEWKELYPVEGAPLDRIFGPTAGPALTVITCGGAFDRSVRSYTHRWVVRAAIYDTSPKAAASPSKRPQ